MSLRNFVTPHCHPQSLDSASTLEAFVKREQELGTGAMTVTDHGSLAACPAIYKLARKAKLTPILGVEGYFRDDDCPILLGAGMSKDEKGTLSDYQKYYHITMHALDQDAYETIGRVLSAADERAERHGSERKPLFTWQQMEEIGAKNVTMTSSCLVGMVQRHLLAGKPELAIKYYEKVRSLVKPGNFFVEAFVHRCDKNWVKGCFVRVAGQEKELRFWSGKKLRVTGHLGSQEPQEMTAQQLADAFQRALDRGRPPKYVLTGRKDQQTWVDLEPAEILNAQAVEDYIQNECTKMAPDGDVQLGANKFMLWMAKKYGDPILISDDSHFAYPEDRVVQDIRLLAANNGNDNWRFYGSYHRQSSDEAFAYFQKYLGITQAQFEGWVENSHQWAGRFGWEWKERTQPIPVKFYPEDTLAHTMTLIRKVGRMNWKDRAMKERLAAEIEMLHRNGKLDLLPYFFPIEELCSYYEQHGELTGTGRGSAAGLLLAYVLGITHVNPLKYELSRERFLTASRIRSGKLPDIDQDLPHRDLLINPKEAGKGWLYERFPQHFAQISTDTMLRVKSSIKDVHRVMHGRVTPEIEALCKRIPTPPQGISDHAFVFGYKDAAGDEIPGILDTNPALQEYVQKFPEEWKTVQKCLGISRQKSKHACAFVITNEPVVNFLPTTSVGDDSIPVTQYTAPYVEQVGGLKYDFLVITSLKDIQGAIRLIQQSVGYTPKDEFLNGMRVPGIRIVPFKKPDGTLALYDVWDLPDDQAVYEDMCAGRTETCFQFNTPGARQWMGLFYQNNKHTLTSVEHFSAFTALDRPGPLNARVTDGLVERNMLEEFAARAAGEKPIGNNAVLDEMLPETHGVIVYQEQLQKVFVALGGTTAEQGDEFRVHVSKKKVELVAADRDIFMPGAIKRLGEEEAERIWGMLFTFGSYGFNKSHSVCYALTGVVSAWLKHHYPTEWWTAVLQNADRGEIDTTFWEHCGKYVDMPDLVKSESDFAIRDGRIRAPLRMLKGVGETAHEELVELRPYTTVREFCEKWYQRRLSKGTVTFEEKTNKKTKEVMQVKKVKLARTALNKTIIGKLILSGAMDSMFPADVQDIYGKLNHFAETKAAVESEVTGKKAKVEKVDPRLLRLTPVQKFLLKKSVLPSYSEDLLDYVTSVLPTDEFKSQRGYRLAWKMPRPFDDEYMCPVVHGWTAKKLLEPGSNGLNPRFKFGVMAYVTDVEWFWQNRACRVQFEVNGERFKTVLWPSKKEKEAGKPAGLPDGFVGSVSILTLARWREDKEFALDDIRIVEPALDFSSKEGSPEPTE